MVQAHNDYYRLDQGIVSTFISLQCWRSFQFCTISCSRSSGAMKDISQQREKSYHKYWWSWSSGASSDVWNDQRDVRVPHLLELGDGRFASDDHAWPKVFYYLHSPMPSSISDPSHAWTKANHWDHWNINLLSLIISSDFRHIAKRLLALQEYFDPQQVTKKSMSWKFRNVHTLPRFATWSATTPTSSWWTGPTCKRRWTSWRRRWTCQQEGFPSLPPPSLTHLTSTRPDTRFVLVPSFERSTHFLSTSFVHFHNLKSFSVSSSLWLLSTSRPWS